MRLAESALPDRVVRSPAVGTLARARAGGLPAGTRTRGPPRSSPCTSGRSGPPRCARANRS
eukprot:10930335-Alexandrium_andersonii.AAC.1